MKAAFQVLVLSVVLFGVVGCATDPETTPTEEEAPRCWSSTAYGHTEEWNACRSANFDSWPVWCDEGAELTKCDFAVDYGDGKTIICRVGYPACNNL